MSGVRDFKEGRQRSCAELLRTPLWRSPQYSTSRHPGEAFSTVGHRPKLGHIGQTVNARGLVYATCGSLQPTCSTPMPRTRLWDSLLLTKASTRTRKSLSFCRICRQNEEPTSGLESLTSSHSLVYVSTPFNALSRFCTTRRQYQRLLRRPEQRTQPYGHSKYCRSSIEVPLPPAWYLPRPWRPGT